MYAYNPGPPPRLIPHIYIIRAPRTGQTNSPPLPAPSDVARLTNLVSLDMSRAFSRASSLLDLGAISHLTTLQELSCSW